jgi:nifR3 family TIM-barrel protein
VTPFAASLPGICAPAVVIRGRDGASVTFDPPLMLAPMEGITDPVFRDRVIAAGGVGGSCTEFIRISVSAIPAKVVRKQLGPLRDDVPVGVQLMAADPEHVAETVRNAERAGAAWIDLNFGCPAPVVFNKCAGSALLSRPEAMAAIVRAAVAATALPVSAKMRAGIDGPARMADCVLAVAEAGAAMVALHARLRCTSYAEPATWRWIAEARAALRRAGHAIPLIGNGGVDAPEDAARMRAETGCDGVMIGRAALADPWIFRQALGGAPPSTTDAARFALGYADAVVAERGERIALSKLKQLTRWYRCGGIFDGREAERAALLRVDSLAALRGWFESRLH